MEEKQYVVGEGEVNYFVAEILSGMKPTKPLLEGKTSVIPIAEGNVDDVCKQVGKWSAYRDVNEKYVVYIKII